MDPYITIKHKETIYRTKTLINGGKKPSWNEKIVIPITKLSKIN
jgi:Ca2+-dependent lipid-binding protein